MTGEKYLDSDIHYVYGGRFTSQGTWSHPVLSLETWELIYMIRGCAYLYEGDRKFEAHAGDCVLLRPGIEHGGYAPSTDTVSFFWLHCRDLTDNTILDGLPTHVTPTESTQIPLFCRQLLHISSLHIYPKAMSDTLMRLLLTEYAVQARTVAPKNSGEIRLINEICEWIRINASKPLSVSSVAAQFQYHEDYLTRLFRAHLGIGVKAYIDSMRIEYIRTMLLTTDEPLKSIATAAGFDDYKAFLKYFTYHESITPTELREHFYRTHTNNH